MEHIQFVKYEKFDHQDDEGLQKYSDLWEFDVSLMKHSWNYHYNETMVHLFQIIL